MILLTRRVSDGEPTATATLNLDTRIKSRVRITLDDGRDAGLMLERGQLIRGGELLADDAGETLVRVVAASEEVSSVYCSDPLALARAAYHLGNRHVPLQVEAGFLRYQHDHVLDEMVRGFGLDVVVEQAPFEPEAGAYQSAPHSHTHSDHLFVRLPAQAAL
ncbi:urease accessory protein UreE [Pseudomonas sp. zfem002]|uniref:urease accessory protein UreE n=1 Tax=Pseudomonas sp. zfem002 TaxID=3078197 RepID=UPI0029284C1F|nr:urease accessory protein UreE [Pseudomonas sp. zfem002]MDU9393588.1 urease accessory protein UreE [Pseudomonas sp. zfem002]